MADYSAHLDSPRILIVARDALAFAAAIRERDGGLDLRAKTPGEVIPRDGDDRNILIAYRVPDPFRGSAGLRRSMPELCWIQSTGAGVDGILSDAGPPTDPSGSPSHRPVPHSVIVTRLTDVFGDPMADYVLARLLAWLQQIPRLERERAARSWRHFVPRGLRGLRVAVLGAGSIGTVVSRRLIANGAEVVCVTRRGAPIAGVGEVLPLAKLGEALSDVEALVVLVPRTAETEGMVGAAELARVARGAFVINVSRGATIDHPALIAALDRGQLAGAALDVFDVEPLPPDSPLWGRDDLMISPHVAAVTSPRMVADALLDNLSRARRGEAMRGVVDRSAGY